MRFYRFVVPVLAALAVAGGSVAAAASGKSARHSKTGKVFVASRGCSGHVFKPRSIVFACGDGNIFANKISWRSYGGGKATGQAVVHINDCSPNCASGHFHKFRSPIRLKRIERCSDGRLYYTRVRYKGIVSNEGVTNHKGWVVAFINPQLTCKPFHRH